MKLTIAKKKHIKKEENIVEKEEWSIDNQQLLTTLSWKPTQNALNSNFKFIF